MSATWIRSLEAGETLVIDGGTGSELERRGMPLRRHDVWSGLAAVTHFDVLRQVHHDYIDAGARVITTNTFGTSRFVLEAAGFGDRFAQVNALAVAAAREARDASGADVAISGSISCLPPHFDVRSYPDAVTEKDAYRELAETLIEHGADFIALEMLQDVEHSALACEAVAAIGLPFWLGLSCRLAPGGGPLVTYDFPETRFEVVLDALLPYAPTVVCAMHSPPDAIAPAIQAINARRGGFVGAYPEWPSNASQSDTAITLADCGTLWRKLGAQVLGGCCGTTPSQIRELATALDTA
jgi:S-methylmethionine-dependent homocysteine/selenocysteine methylase